jgi:RNA polymerase primary sigma factor
MRQLKISQSITNRETPSLEKYLSDIAKLPMVTPQEEVALTQKIRQGDQAAVRCFRSQTISKLRHVARRPD